MIQIVRPRTIIEEICGIGDPQPIPAQTPQSPDGLLTEEQAAQLAGVSRKTIRKLIKAGRLQAVDLGCRNKHHYRIKAESLATIQSPAADAPVVPRHSRRATRQATTGTMMDLLPKV